MTIVTNYIVYPEGDIQETGSRLQVNQVVDLNGNPLPLPLKTTRLIAFRVFKISTDEKKGEENRFHYLELLNREELDAYL